MEKIEINSFCELEKIKNLRGGECIVNLCNCSFRERLRIVDFLCGLTFLDGYIRKLSCNEFEVRSSK